MAGLRAAISCIFIAILTLATGGDFSAESLDMWGTTTKLPKQLGRWTLVGSPRRIDSETIFDYMNGAGELYLAYHFHHLTVAEYGDAEDNRILVEVYRMKGPNDAFGLLSMDWGGEPVALHAPPAPAPEADFPNALYGKGLLRLRSGNVYARVLATRETPGVREIIMRIGGMIASRAANPVPPDLVRALPEMVAGDWRLDRRRIGYFYSHLVLNSHHYISHDNILDLDRDCEAVIALYSNGRSRRSESGIRLLAVRYKGAELARKAALRFVTAYLPERTGKQDNEIGPDELMAYEMEDGWMGLRLSGRHLVLAVGCPDSVCVKKILDPSICNRFQNTGGEYEK